MAVGEQPDQPDPDRVGVRHGHTNFSDSLTIRFKATVDGEDLSREPSGGRVRDSSPRGA